MGLRILGMEFTVYADAIHEQKQEGKSNKSPAAAKQVVLCLYD